MVLGVSDRRESGWSEGSGLSLLLVLAGQVSQEITRACVCDAVRAVKRKIRRISFSWRRLLLLLCPDWVGVRRGGDGWERRALENVVVVSYTGSSHGNIHTSARL